jgi:hypothetical protein
MSTTPAPTWPIEPTTLYVVSYFSSNAANTQPSFVDPIMYDYNTALAKAKEYIAANGNVGVCTLQQTSCTVVFPSVPWKDF